MSTFSFSGSSIPAPTPRVPAAAGVVPAPAAILWGGLLLGFSYPPFPLPFLAWFAFVPLLLRWSGGTPARQCYFECYGMLLIAFCIAFSWPLFHVLPRTALASLGGWLLLPLLMAVPAGLSARVRDRLGRGAGLAAFAAFYLAMECGLSHGPLAFPWMLLGHTQAEALHLNQFAEYTGVPGLSLWVLGLNLLGLFLFQVSTFRGRILILAGLAGALFLPFLFSQWRLAHLPAPAAHARVGLVQPATAPTAWADVHNAARVDRLLALSDSLLGAGDSTPDLLIWPETALPVFDRPEERRALYAALQRWTDARGLPLLTGAVTRPEGLSGEKAPGPAYYNSARLFRPDAAPLQYDKVLLVPFAEGVPLAETFPALSALSVPAGGVAGYRRGAGAAVLRTSNLSLGVLICFESLFGGYARRYVERGAGLLVVLAQDGWWGRTPGYRQHLAFNRLRAVETRRAIVQVAATGTSAVILPSGASAVELPWMAARARSASVPLHTTTTFYSRHGDWIGPAAVLLSLFFILFSSRFNVEEKRTLNVEP